MKTKETNPTRPGSPTLCKQALSRGFLLYNKNAVTAAFSLTRLEIRSRNEEAINSTRNRNLLAKGFLLPSLSSSILFICF